ncbi:hypothetical protein LBMAG13_05410 [Actinomycetes bacterium]|nr:hypothetical protein LBMAG13_05410 [Actinomycetes bacterium]
MMRVLSVVTARAGRASMAEVSLRLKEDSFRIKEVAFRIEAKAGGSGLF